MRKKIACALMVGLVCLLFAACGAQVSVNGLPPEEKYISVNYPDYTIVKSAAVGNIKAFLLKGESDYDIVYFQDGEYSGGTSDITGLGTHAFWDSYGHLVIVGGENPDCMHAGYTLSFRDNPESGGDLVSSLSSNKDNWNQTVITRDVSRQEYILDVYLLPVYYNIDLQNTRWDDGSLF